MSSTLDEVPDRRMNSTSAAGGPTIWRIWMMAAAGLGVMLLSLGVALLRLNEGWSGSRLIASLLVAAGFIELTAGALRRQGYLLAMIAGSVTVSAGLLFTVDPATKFVPAVYVLVGWLALRGVVLVASGLRVRGTARTWTLLSAATDLALALVILIGLSAATLTIWLFGPTSTVIQTFGWAVAFSLVVTGAYLLEVAHADAATVASSADRRFSPTLKC